MLRRSLVTHLYPHPLVECVAIVKQAGVSIQVMWQLGNVPACLEYPRGRRSEVDRNPEGQSRGYDMTSLQTVPCHITGMRVLSYWKR